MNEEHAPRALAVIHHSLGIGSFGLGYIFLDRVAISPTHINYESY
jgi:hypothetical protein